MSANRSQVTKPGMLNSLAPRLLIVAAVLMAAVAVLQATGAAKSVIGLFTPRPSPMRVPSAEPAGRSLHNLETSAYARSEDHGDVLQEVAPAMNVGGWYGAIPQDSPLFNAAASEMQREIVVNHGEALQDIAP